MDKCRLCQKTKPLAKRNVCSSCFYQTYTVRHRKNPYNKIARALAVRERLRGVKNYRGISASVVQRLLEEAEHRCALTGVVLAVNQLSLRRLRPEEPFSAEDNWSVIVKGVRVPTKEDAAK